MLKIPYLFDRRKPISRDMEGSETMRKIHKYKEFSRKVIKLKANFFMYFAHQHSFLIVF